MTQRSEYVKIILGPGSTPGDAPFKAYTRESSGLDTPGRLREVGILPENDYTAAISTVRDGPLQFVTNPLQYPPNVQYSRSSTIGASISLDPVDEPILASTVSSLLENWRGSQFNAGVTVGEGRESLTMVAGRLISLNRAFSHLKRGNLGGALRHIGPVPRNMRRRSNQRLGFQDIPGAWMELRYGWRPLLSDIYNFAEFIELKPRNDFVRASNRNSNPSGHAAGGGIDIKPSVGQNEKVIYLKVRVSSQPSLYERLGLTNPAMVAWELTPFSFVADWFVPIGNYIQSLHALRAMPVVSCCTTNVTRQKARLTVPPGNWAGVYTLNTCVNTVKSTSMVRRGDSGLPSAWSILSQIPGSINNPLDFDLKRVADAAALLSANLRGTSFHR